MKPPVRLFPMSVAIALVLLVASDIVVRLAERGSLARAAWYQGVSDRMESGRVNFLFIGTSRTASGFVPHVFEEEVEAETGETVAALNLGRAFSGAVAHYFGCRELLRRHPEGMRGCTVSLEMSAGLPAFHGTWDDAWFFPGNTQLIVDYMSWSDLVRFLRTDAGFEAKAGVLARWLGRGSALVSGRRSIQQRVDWGGVRTVRAVLAKLGARSAPSSGAELPANRQARTDFGGVQLQRDLILERTGPEALAAQLPLGSWDDQVFCQLARMLDEHGVRVLFHDVPVPSYVWEVNDTEIRVADRSAFGKWRADHGIREVRASMELTDEDFPDLSHLRASRVGEYSRGLARSIVALKE